MRKALMISGLDTLGCLGTFNRGSATAGFFRLFHHAFKSSTDCPCCPRGGHGSLSTLTLPLLLKLLRVRLHIFRSVIVFLHLLKRLPSSLIWISPGLGTTGQYPVNLVAPGQAKGRPAEHCCPLDGPGCRSGCPAYLLSMT